MSFEEDQELARLQEEGRIPSPNFMTVQEALQREGFGDEGPEVIAHAPSDEDQAAYRLKEVAEQVLAGEWGTGQNKRIKLSEAGFDHREVEREVIRLVNLKA